MEPGSGIHCRQSRPLGRRYLQPRLRGQEMPKMRIGDSFPAAKFQDIDGETVEFPAVFAKAPATVVFFYRGRW